MAADFGHADLLYRIIEQVDESFAVVHAESSGLGPDFLSFVDASFDF